MHANHFKPEKDEPWKFTTGLQTVAILQCELCKASHSLKYFVFL